MPRVLLSLVFIVHLAGASEVVPSLGDDPCSESCPDDGPDGKCPPNCPSCDCCPHVRPVVTAEALAADGPLAGAVVLAVAQSVPVAPEPRDILHVPKAFLA